MWQPGSTLWLWVLVTGVTWAKEVTIPDLGTLEGTTTLSAWTNRTIFQYQGIPYAEPPIGTLRFKPPEPFRGRWTQTFDASSFGPVCPQRNGVPPSKGRMHEDCLHINVYTPKTEGGGEGTGLPVMIYIHGGSFHVGSARNVLPNYLLEQDIVLAVPQYRLGPLGFLSLKTDDVPGNQGILDVLLAIEWVHNNIEHFGGDPKRVTLFGQSAGAAAVNLMLFSPMVRDGIFQRVITLGGSILGKWGVDPEPIKHTKMIAAHINCTQSDLSELASCLRQKTANQLLLAHEHFMELGISIGHQVVWNEAGERSFLSDDPNVLLREGKIKLVPMLSGVTKHDGSFVVAWLYDRLKASNQTALGNPISLDFLQLILERAGVYDKTGFVTNVVAERYFKEDDFKDFLKMVPGLMDIAGVSVMKAAVLTMLKTMSRHSQSFLYSFNYLGNHSSFGNFATFGRSPDNPWNCPFSAGVAHGDDLLYIFPQEYAVLEGEDELMAKKMVQVFTNFVKHGHPSAEGFPAWPTFSGERGPYMRIDETPAVRESFIEEFFVVVNEGLPPST